MQQKIRLHTILMLLLLTISLVFTPSVANAVPQSARPVVLTKEQKALQAKIKTFKDRAVKTENQNDSNKNEKDINIPVVDSGNVSGVKDDKSLDTSVVLRVPDVDESVDKTRQELERKYGDPVAVNEDEVVYREDATHFVTYLGGEAKTFKDEQGKETPLDLELEKISKDSFAPKSSPVEVSLPSTVDENKPVVVKNKDRELKISPEGKTYKNAVVLDNAIRYNEVSKGVDTQYTVSVDGVKEDIILRKYLGEHVFSYVFPKKGFKAKLELNQIVVEDEQTGELLFILSAPLMVDSKGVSSNEIKLGLSVKDGFYLVSLDADKDWLTDKNRVYPVKIDPTITVPSSSLIEVTTSTVRERYKGRAYGYAGYITPAMLGVPTAKPMGSARMFFKINYDFKRNIPLEARIDSAILNVYQYANYPQSRGNSFASYMIRKPWNPSTLVWDNSTALNPKISGKKAVFPYKTGLYSFDIKTAVTEWVNGITPNYGLFVKATDEGDYGGAFYTPYSVSSGGGQGGVTDSKKPRIVIKWSVPDPVNVNHPLDKTTVELYPMGVTDEHGKLAFQGVIGAGVATPGAKVSYYLNDSSKKYKNLVPASYSYKYPNSANFEAAFPKGVNKWREKEGNWQTILPFTKPSFNIKYFLNAKAAKNGKTGKTAKSDTFIIYKVKQFDTLPKIANYYGVELSQIAYDNHIQDMLLLKNNVLFIRNPKKNAKNPYNPSKLLDSDKAKIDALLMGRGLHCEFGFEPINLNTGNFYLNHEDISITDYANDFKIERNYNAKSGLNSVFGYGWDFLYDEQITHGDKGTFLYKRHDGSLMQFSKKGDKYVSPAGYDLELKLRKVKDKTAKFSTGKKTYPVYEYVIEDKDGGKKTFNYHGLLTSIQDNNGGKTSVKYDKNFNLKKIISPAGTAYNVKTTIDGRIERIVLPNGASLKYGYDDNGDLVSYTDAVGSVTKYKYDDKHRMVSWIDGEGRRVITNTYDKQDRVVKQVDGNGKTSTLKYGKTSTIAVDGDGNKTVYTYDNRRRTTKIQYANGSNITKTYTNDNRVKTVTDQLGRTTSYSYDKSGNVVSETAPAGSIKRSFDNKNHVTSITDKDGNKTRFTYVKGHLNKVYFNGQLRETITADKYGRIISKTDALGNTTKYAYDGAFLTSITDATKAKTVFKYNTLGKPVKIVNAKDQVAVIKYDKGGHVLSETDADGVKTTYEYDKAGNVTAIIDGNGVKKTSIYDALGNRIAASNGGGGKYAYSYNATGKLLTTKNAEGGLTRYTYDAVGNLVKETDPKGNSTTYVYDVAGRRVSETGENGGVTKYSYDGNDNIVLVTDALGNSLKYAYSKTGLLESIIHPDGVKESFTYNNQNQLISKTGRDGRKTSYTYDAVGNVLTQTRSGETTTYTYSPLRQVASVKFNDGATITNTYDKLGNLASRRDANGNTTKYVYSAMGKLRSVTDPLGNRSSYTYDGNGNQNSITDPSGARAKTVFGPQNLPVKLTDSLGNSTKYAYNQMEQVTEIKDALGGKTTYEYDDNGLPIKVTDAKNNAYQFSYTASGWIEKIVAPDSSSITYSYDLVGQVVKETYSSGYEKNYEYNKLSQKVREWDNDRIDERYVYDKNGHITSSVNKVGQTTSYSYDEQERLTQIVKPDGKTISYTYDKAGNVAQSKDVEGKVTRFTYDKNGNLLSSTDHVGRVYAYKYNEVGELVSETNPLGETTTYEHDVLGNVVKVTDANGESQKFGFDAMSNPTYYTDANGNTTLLEYDKLNRVVKGTHPNGGVEKYVYDPLGNQTQLIDPLGGKTITAYDNMNRPVSVVKPNGGKTVYAYDKYGLLAKETNPLGAVTKYSNNVYGQVTSKVKADGATYTYAYDMLGRIEKIGAPLGLSKTFTYDKSSNITTVTDQSGRVVKYGYDKAGRITKATNPLGFESKYVYDAKGDLNKAISPMGQVTNYRYDALGRLAETLTPEGRKTAVKYDKVGNVVEQTVNGEHKTRFSYDANHNLIEQVDALGGKQSFAYDVMNQVSKYTNPLGQVTNYAYDKKQQLVSASLEGKGSVGYRYDPNGNLTHVIDGAGRAKTYTYDLADQLVKATTGSASDVREMKYEYDVVGNLIKKTDGNSNQTSFEYNQLGQVTKEITPTGDSTSYIYDKNANLAKKVRPSGKTITYDYNKLDDLVKIDYEDKKSEGSVLYAYDKDGRRVSMVDKTGQSLYQYDKDGLITGVKQADGSLIKYEYDKFGNISALIYPDGSKVEYVYDALDRLIKVKDLTGNTVKYTYDAASNMTGVDRGDGSNTRLEYDEANRVVKVVNTSSSGKNISTYTYSYDDAGNISSEIINTTDKSVRNVYGYNTAGELESVTSQPVANSPPKQQKTTYANQSKTNNPTPTGEATVTTYGYDKVGNKISISRKNTKGESKTSFEYDKNNALISSSDGITYVYDKDGNRIRKLEKGEQALTYHYDTESRLIAVKDKQGLLFAALYDGDSNRVFTANRTSKQTSYKLFKRSPKTSVLGDKLSLFWKGFTTSLVQGFNVSNGATGKVWHDSWDDMQSAYNMHLAKVKANREGIIVEPENIDKNIDWNKVQYASSAKTALIPYATKQDTDTYFEVKNFVNDINQTNTQVLSAYDENGKTVEKFDYGNQRLNYITPEKSYRYQYDGRGSVTSITDTAGKIKDTYSYSGYGVSERGSPQTANPYKYNAEYVDTATSMQYLRARYYDNSSVNANIFLTRDTYLGEADNVHSQNKYLYANSNPINYIDPTGHSGWGLWNKAKNIASQAYKKTTGLVSRSFGFKRPNIKSSNPIRMHLGNRLSTLSFSLKTNQYATNTSRMCVGKPRNVGHQSLRAFQLQKTSIYPLGSSKSLRSGIDRGTDLIRSWSKAAKLTYQNFCNTADKPVEQKLICGFLGYQKGGIDVGLGTLQGVYNFTPIPYVIKNGNEDGYYAYGQMLKNTGRYVWNHPDIVAKEALKDYVGYEYWNKSKFEATGIVVANLGLTFAGGAGVITKIGKVGRAASKTAQIGKTIVRAGMSTSSARTVVRRLSRKGKLSATDSSTVNFVNSRMLASNQGSVKISRKADSSTLTSPMKEKVGKEQIDVLPIDGKTDPWKPGSYIFEGAAPKDLEVYMAVKDIDSGPGSWGTLDKIDSVDFVRKDLAVTPGFKDPVTYVKRYRIPEGTQIRIGTVGPQTDKGVFYPGGGNQIQIVNEVDKKSLMEIQGQSYPIK